MTGKIIWATFYGFYIKNWKRTLLITLYNGRIDISHIVRTQEIILINLTNTIVQSMIMAYSHILMVTLGEEVVRGKEGIVSF